MLSNQKTKIEIRLKEKSFKEIYNLIRKFAKKKTKKFSYINYMLIIAKAIKFKLYNQSHLKLIDQFKAVYIYIYNYYSFYNI